MLASSGLNQFRGEFFLIWAFSNNCEVLRTSVELRNYLDFKGQHKRESTEVRSQLSITGSVIPH